MKKNILFIILMITGMIALSQTPRLSLCEEFTGENCGPCAATNPGLNAVLSSNSTKVIAIKWQVAIPSAPTATWSLYQTNKIEIGTRGSYYGNSFAPEARIDGQHLTTFGAASDHAGYIDNNLINNAQAITSSFSITMNRAWANGCNAVDVTVTVTATGNFTTTSALNFRTVMVERTIVFNTSPGSNGEKTFYDVGIKSFPNIQTGTPLPNSWVAGQTFTFALNCVIPSYTRDKSQVAFVGFIQNEANKKVLQAARINEVPFPTDALTAVDATVNTTCSSTIAPQITFQNNGPNALTSCTIMPFTDGVMGNTTPWTGNLAVNASTSIMLNPINTSSANGAHIFSYQIATGSPYFLNNGLNTFKYVVATSFQTIPVMEAFGSPNFPPLGWTSISPSNDLTWTYGTGSFGDVNHYGSVKFDFYNNTVIGAVDELYLPPIDLSGPGSPTLSFDIAKAQRSTENDQLDVLVSNDCGVNWTNVYSKAGSYLSTTALMSSPFPAFFPQDWIRENIILTGFSSPNVLVKFKATNDHGNNMYLDDINLLSSTTGISKNKYDASNISVFPNPAKDQTNLKITATTASNSTIILMNNLGQIVFKKQQALTIGINAIQLDVKELADGLYNVIVESNNSTVAKKITIVK